MNSKPLSYDSLKTVLRYLQPNTRILLSSRIPSIRFAERAVPMKIKNLCIATHYIEINRTRYHIGIYRSGDDRRVNGVNGHTCDVDEFGIPGYIKDGILPVEKNLFGERGDGDLEHLERRLEKEKLRLSKLLEFQSREICMDEWNTFYSIMGNCPNLPQHYKYGIKKDNKEAIQEAIKLYDWNIKLMENDLVPFQNRRDNFRPKLEIRVIKNWSVVERVNYTGDLHKAIKALFEFMFSKKLSIQVDSFRSFSKCPMSLDIKLRVRNLMLAFDHLTNLELVKSIIDEKLEKMTIFTNYLTEDLILNFDENIIKTSKHLKISKLNKNDKIFPFIRRLGNETIELGEAPKGFLESKDFIIFIRKWVKLDKPIGTCLIIGYYAREDDKCIKILNRVSKIRGAIAGDKYVNVPMRSPTVLKVSNERLSDRETQFKMVVVDLDLSSI
uniref:F-box domain-containing protein n=1 Tax=Caenorhabditis tropicalis TaxID=1561998 RepID=A0A1I7UR08_9PELO